MANKNDLRFVKTEKLIEETYLKLRGKSGAPVKVSELCETALINKTTFYTPYETIEALHTHICQKTIETMLDSCPDVNKAFADTSAFVTSIVKMIGDNTAVFHTVFGKDFAGQTNVFEECLLKRYLSGDESEEMKMKIVFAIGGAARLLLGDQNDERIRMTVKLISQVLTNKYDSRTNGALHSNSHDYP